ncbi:Acidic leucine-rich nuclear phosphoprotein 32-related protein [Acorus calamus]|uniref:Acidic leucine-rich nuclear phosphoprotein 32-related protein n=1 Tax=Acorus calamus TaxID=4465 RepID=A0AAV9EZA8_ACOCL|nr:Acidic leucine-rich nuclear phosphoprotein 32-related protein [Acorus calamus]
MDEMWERAVETALEGQSDVAAVKTLTLDGAAKCVHGRLPPPGLLEKFQGLEHLSIANVGVSSLEKFPRLKNLQRLILSDNRIAGGLEFLVEAGLESLRDLDLSNNRIQYIDDLEPLARIQLVSLDLYECPVTRIKDYRSKVFGLIRTLKYLDKMDSDENERPESEDEEEEEDVEEEEEDDEDPGSGEVDGEDRSGKLVNGVSGGGSNGGGIVEADGDDEEEESDADEEETETVRGLLNGRVVSNHHASNGVHVEEDEEDVGEEEDDDLGEEIDEEDGEEEEEDVVEVLDIADSDEDEDVIAEEDEEDEDEGDGEEEEDEVDDEDEEPGNSGMVRSGEGVIDGHEQGEGEEEDENGEIGEDEQGLVQGLAEVRDFEVEDDDDDDDDDGEGEDEEEDFGAGEYLVQPINHVADNGGHDFDAGNNDDSEEEEEVDDEEEGAAQPSSAPKRKRDEEDDSGSDDDEDSRSPKRR